MNGKLNIFSLIEWYRYWLPVPYRNDVGLLLRDGIMISNNDAFCVPDLSLCAYISLSYLNRFQYHF